MKEFFVEIIKKIRQLLFLVIEEIKNLPKLK